MILRIYFNHKFLKLTTISILVLYCCLPFSAFAKQKNLTYYNPPVSDNEESLDDFDFDFDSSDSKVLNIRDPLEKTNRRIFAFNEVVDKYFLEHVARAYRKALPKFIRKPIRNFITNLSLPLVIVNSVLQGNIENSLSSFSRLLINSTIGIGGLFDVASTKNIKYHKEDLGQTLGKYGWDSSIYMVIPFLGPSTLRDSTGLLIESLVDPMAFNTLEIGGKRDFLNNNILISLAIVKTIDKRESLLEVISDSRKSSFDFYATARSAYFQNRNFKINNKE